LTLKTYFVQITVSGQIIYYIFTKRYFFSKAYDFISVGL